MKVEGCAPSSTGRFPRKPLAAEPRADITSKISRTAKQCIPSMISKDTTGTQGSPAHLRRGLQAPRSSPFPHRQPRWTWRELRALQGRLGQNRSSSSLRILSQPRLQAGNSQACSWVLFTKVSEPEREGQPQGQLGCGF